VQNYTFRKSTLNSLVELYVKSQLLTFTKQHLSSDNIFVFSVMTSIHWPNTGNNSQYFILDVPYLSVGILNDALAFISSHCYYRETRNRHKYLKFPGVSPTPVAPMTETINLDPDPDGANDPKNKDMYRFQTAPDAQEILLTCSAIAAILSKV